jgi:predicted metal-dependent hydrolase
LKFDWIFEKPPYQPGHGSKPLLPEATTALTENSWSSHEIFQLGLLCHQQGYYWEAHEILESLWHLQSGALKDFVQVLIQRAAAELKIRQDDPGAAHRLRTSAISKIHVIKAQHLRLLGFDLDDLLRELESKTQGEARST